MRGRMPRGEWFCHFCRWCVLIYLLKFFFLKNKRIINSIIILMMIGFIYKVFDGSLRECWMFQQFLRDLGHLVEDGPSPRKTSHHIYTLCFSLFIRQKFSKAFHFFIIILFYDLIESGKEKHIIFRKIFFMENLT